MGPRLRALLPLSALLLGWASDGVPMPGGLDPHAIDEDCGALVSERPPGARARPTGHALGSLDRATCERLLGEAAVPFVPADGLAAAVEQPIRLAGPVGGVRIVPSGGEPDSIHSILDCRLALALARWTPALRARGVAGIEHVSMYRPNARIRGTGRVSGHAHGLALDALAFVLDDGTRLPVLRAWLDRAAGADPCAEHQDDPGTARMRGAVCAAVEQDLFQVVLTPHHDAAHANHVHLEVRPHVGWSFVR